MDAGCHVTCREASNQAFCEGNEQICKHLLFRCQLVVPLRFTIIFTQKYPSLNPLMEHHMRLTGKQWAKIEPLIPQLKSAATLGRPSIDDCLVLDEMVDFASRVALFIFTVHMHVEPAHAAL
jgi:hypothetical protein